MTNVYDHCPYCNRDVTLAPSDIIIQLEAPRSVRGTYRWHHECNGGPIVKKANFRIINVLLAAGANLSPHFVPPMDDETVINTFSRQLDEVETLADMGWVS